MWGLWLRVWGGRIQFKVCSFRCEGSVCRMLGELGFKFYCTPTYVSLGKSEQQLELATATRKPEPTLILIYLTKVASKSYDGTSAQPCSPLNYAPLEPKYPPLQ